MVVVGQEVRCGRVKICKRHQNRGNTLRNIKGYIFFLSGKKTDENENSWTSFAVEVWTTSYQLLMSALFLHTPELNRGDQNFWTILLSYY